jgi:hypothetical protein
MSKKPDMFAENKSVMPYGDNVGAPAIRPDDVDTWKNEKVIKTNHYFETKYDEIKEEYKKLIERYEWNKLVYESDFKFEPVKGQTYYLYQRDTGSLFLSLIEPEYNNWLYIGGFKLDSEDKWEKVDETTNS